MLDIMGHELRTPATVVKLASHMLDKHISSDDKEGQEDLFRIQDSIEREIRLINTFINTAKIDNNKLELSLSPVHLDEVLQQAVEEHKAEAEGKNLVLSCEKIGAIPVVL